ncbi:MAG: protein-tyrosine-phosphatase [Marinoscillum sp.]
MKAIKIICLIGLVLIFNHTKAQLKIEINDKLQDYTRDVIQNLEDIPEERKASLKDVGDFLVNKVRENGSYDVLFVCTHNSRRSHLADTWFKYALLFYGVDSLESYSGGLEETAFNKNAIAALERAGFTIHYSREVDNPAVAITPGLYPVWRMKSKVYSNKVNPKSDFVAIMVCSDADQSCPLVPGASGRFALAYNDPRYFDSTPAQDMKYDQTAKEIAIEMFYLADYMKSQQIRKLEVTKR